MENEVGTVRKITGELIGGFFLYGIVYGIVYSIIFSAITNDMQSEKWLLKAIIAIVLQAVFAFFIWRSSIKSTFKKRVVNKNDVPQVMKNLIIFTIIICVINFFVNYIELKKGIDELDEKLDNYTSFLYNDAKEELEEEVEKMKSQLYSYFVVLELGLCAAYVAVVPMQKNKILEHSV